MYKPSPDVLIGENGGGVKALCTAILIQAILDYQELNNKGVAVIDYPKTGRISKNEITRFFKSKWGAELLATIGGHYNGKQIINILKGEAPPGELSKDRKIAALTPKGELVATFKTLSECARFAGLKFTGDICKCCNGQRNTAGGYVWKYI